MTRRRLRLACTGWGDTCNNLHDFPNAITCLEESLALLITLGERFWRARAMNELGICHIQMGQPAEAIAYSQAALDLRREIDDQMGVGWCLHDLGMAHYFLGQLDQAEHYWHDSLQQVQDVGSSYAQTSVLQHLSDMAFWSGEFEKLLSFNETLLSVYAERERSSPPRRFHIIPGLAAGLDGDYEQCQTRCAPMRNSGNFHVRLGLAIAASGLGDWAAASEHLKDMLKGVRPVGYGSLLNWKLPCPPIAALVLAQEGEPEQAAELLGLAFNFPPHRIGWLKRWQLIADLADDLETHLGDETYAAAWEHGQTLDIDDVITSLRARFAVDVDAQQQANDALDDPLTPRELEVLNLIYAGHTNPEIADQLVLAESTVKRHINHIYSKLAVSNRTQALAHTRDLGLLD